MNWGKKDTGMEACQEISCTRVLSMPREVTWLFLTDPEMLRLWWLPEGYSNPFPRGPRSRWPGWWKREGGEKLVFTDIARPSRLSFRCDESPAFSAHLALADRVGATSVSFTARFSRQPADATLHEMARKGCREMFARIDEKVAGLYRIEPARVLLLEREIDAPRELVWKFWTDPGLFGRWWPQGGARLGNPSLDLRPGGSFHFSIPAPAGERAWVRFEFREVVRGEQLVMRHYFSDERGNVCPHPRSELWPREFLLEVAFTERHDKFVLALHACPVGYTKFEADFYNEREELMRSQWTLTFDRLAAAIAGYRSEKWAPKTEPPC